MSDWANYWRKFCYSVLIVGTVFWILSSSHKMVDVAERGELTYRLYCAGTPQEPTCVKLRQHLDSWMVGVARGMTLR